MATLARLERRINGIDRKVKRMFDVFAEWEIDQKFLAEIERLKHVKETGISTKELKRRLGL